MPPELPPAYRLQVDALDWSARPVATELRPLGLDLWRRYHRLTERRFESRPDPALNGRFCEADVHWRLLAADGRGLDLAPEDADRWLDAAGVAAFYGGEALLGETLARAPALEAAREVVDFATSPSLELGRDEGGKVKLRHPLGGLTERERERALTELRPDLQPRPRFAMGLGWRLADEDDAGGDLRWGAWLDAANVGLSDLRAELALNDLSWSLSGRRRVWRGLHVLGGMRSAEDGPDFARWSLGLQAQLPAAPGWSLRLDRVVRWSDGQVSWQLSARAELGAWMPGRLQPSLGGLPAVAPRGPEPAEDGEARCPAPCLRAPAARRAD